MSYKRKQKTCDIVPIAYFRSSINGFGLELRRSQEHEYIKDTMLQYCDNFIFICNKASLINTFVFIMLLQNYLKIISIMTEKNTFYIKTTA